MHVSRYIHKYLIVKEISSSHVKPNEDINTCLQGLQNMIMNEKYVKHYFRGPQHEYNVIHGIESIKRIYEQTVETKKYFTSNENTRTNIKQRPIFRKRKNAMDPRSVDLAKLSKLKRSGKVYETIPHLNGELRECFRKRSIPTPPADEITEVGSGTTFVSVRT